MNKRNKILVIIFFISFFFIATQLKDIWSIRVISKYVNFLLIIIPLYFFINEYSGKSNRINNNYKKNFLIPFCGIFIFNLLNYSRSIISDFSNISLLGLLIPWSICLLISVSLISPQNLLPKFWKYAYYIFLNLTILAILDFYLIRNGYVGRLIDTPLGAFQAGFISITHVLSDGEIYNRLYGCFSEPGTFSMFLLPFIIYSFLKRNYIGLSVFSVALVMTKSLGGYFSLFLASSIIILVFKNRLTKAFLGLLFGIFIIFYNIITLFQTSYIAKNLSAETRELNFTEGLKNIPSLLINYPFGMPLSSLTELNQSNEGYFGSNFTFLTYLYHGGFVSFFCYSYLIYNCCVYSYRILSSHLVKNIELKIVAVSVLSLIPFHIQRTTVWESPIFAFLFLPAFYLVTSLPSSKSISRL